MDSYSMNSKGANLYIQSKDEQGQYIPRFFFKGPLRYPIRFLIVRPRLFWIIQLRLYQYMAVICHDGPVINKLFMYVDDVYRW